MLNGFVHIRRSLIAAVTAASFSLFSGATALARTPVVGDPALPAPVSLVLTDAPAEAALAPIPAPDIPDEVPAQQAASPARLTVSVLGILGIVVLAVIIIAGIAIWDLTTNNE